MEGGKDGGHQKSEEDGAVGDERTLTRNGAPLRPCKSAKAARGETVIDALAQRQDRPIVQPADGV